MSDGMRMMFPMIMQNPDPAPPEVTAKDSDWVPARVQMAMVVLNQLTAKARGQHIPGPDGTSGSEIEAPEILPVERKMQAAACDLLIEYLGGRVRYHDWERPLTNEEKKQAGISPDGKPQGLCFPMPCPKCKSQPQMPPCGPCKGRGYRVVQFVESEDI